MAKENQFTPEQLDKANQDLSILDIKNFVEKYIKFLKDYHDVICNKVDESDTYDLINLIHLQKKSLFDIGNILKTKRIIDLEGIEFLNGCIEHINEIELHKLEVEGEGMFVPEQPRDVINTQRDAQSFNEQRRAQAQLDENGVIPKVVEIDELEVSLHNLENEFRDITLKWLSEEMIEDDIKKVIAKLNKLAKDLEAYNDKINNNPNMLGLVNQFITELKKDASFMKDNLKALKGLLSHFSSERYSRYKKIAIDRIQTIYNYIGYYKKQIFTR